jgi:SAM-dependent methyltransferase
VNIFKSYAQYYDLLYKDKDYLKETDYLIERINTFNPDTKTILELGCGTGRHAELLTTHGYKVDGIDQSADMISFATQRLEASTSVKNQISYFVGDIRSFRSGTKYDAVLSLFHVMSYQTNDSDIQESLNTVNDHLSPGGILIFDCWYGPAVLADKPNIRLKSYEDSSMLIERKSIPKLLTDKNQVEVKFLVTVTDKISGQTEQFDEIHNMRYFFDPEIESFIHESNMELIHKEEWITGNPPDEKSWYVTYIAKKI